MIGGEEEPVLSQDQMRESSIPEICLFLSVTTEHPLCPLSDREFHQTSPFLLCIFSFFYLVSTLTLMMLYFPCSARSVRYGRARVISETQISV